MAGTVTVACKLPNGLRLRVQRSIDRQSPDPRTGVRKETISVWDQSKGEVEVKGFAHPRDVAADYPIVGGYALTHGIDADFFAEWLRQNAEHPAVKGGFIFAQEKSGAARDAATERKKELSGFEPVDPKHLPAEFSRSVKAA